MVSLLRARGLSYARIRRSEEYARKAFRIPNPFVTEMLWTSGSEVFLEWSQQLVAISRSGQLWLPTLGEMLQPANHGLCFDDAGEARSWRPQEGIVLDPEVEFGAPCIDGTRIQAETIWSMHEAGDTLETLAAAYGLGHNEVTAAIEWHQKVALAA
jgi:uncharacterized protein (DUF433 family)